MYSFKKEDAFRFADHMRAEAKQRGDELQFKSCPYCKGGHNRKDKGTFSINLINGKFRCLRASCNAKGNMITLHQDFDFSLGTEIDQYYQPKQYRTFKRPDKKIEPREEAIRYLEARGISPETTEKYEITIEKGTNNILVFPFFDEEGELQFIKKRKTDFDKEKDKNKEWCEKNCKPILFGMKQCEVEKDRIVITEGQIDSLSVAEAGIKNAVSVPTGANGFTWVPYCWDWLNEYKEIVVFGDYEKGKISLLEELSKRFKQIKHVRKEDYKDCKDANEILQKYGKEAVANAVNNAISLPVRKIKDMSLIGNLNVADVKKLPTGIKAIDDELKGGIPFGMVCLITGKRGEGKSTFASQVLSNALNENLPILAYSGELPNELFKSWFVTQVVGKYVEKSETASGTRYDISQGNMKIVNNWLQDRAFLYDNTITADDEEDDLIELIRTSIKRYGIKVVLIDNLMTAMYIDSEKSLEKNDRQGRFVRALTKIAMESECVIILIAHRRKNSGIGSDANDEVSGSGDITNLAGVVMSYDRGTPKEIENGTLSEEQRKVIIAKNRLFGKLNLKGIVLNYDEVSRRVYNSLEEKNRVYKCFEKQAIEEKEKWEHAEQEEIPF